MSIPNSINGSKRCEGRASADARCMTMWMSVGEEGRKEGRCCTHCRWTRRFGLSAVLAAAAFVDDDDDDGVLAAFICACTAEDTELAWSLRSIANVW